MTMSDGMLMTIRLTSHRKTITNTKHLFFSRGKVQLQHLTRTYELGQID